MNKEIKTILAVVLVIVIALAILIGGATYLEYEIIEARTECKLAALKLGATSSDAIVLCSNK